MTTMCTRKGEDVAALKRQLCAAVAMEAAKVPKDVLDRLGGMAGAYDAIADAVDRIVDDLMKRHGTVRQLFAAWEDPNVYDGGLLLYDLSSLIAHHLDAAGWDATKTRAEVARVLSIRQ